MIKRIGINDVTLGMYVHEICGTWTQHPFWRTSFLLNDPKDLARLRQSGIREIRIDSTKGLDVKSGAAPQHSEDASFVREAHSDGKDNSEPQKSSKRNTGTLEVTNPEGGQVLLSMEIERARRICRRAMQAVGSMFNEARLGNLVVGEEVNSLVQEVSESLARNSSAIVSLARLKTADQYTYMHSVAVCALMIALAKQMKMTPEEIHFAGLAGLLHDIGKAAISQSLLNKPTNLSHQDFQIVKTHCSVGYAMLQKAGGIPDAVMEACLHHHEKIDGSGYPDRIGGDGISVLARMTAVCDVYDAITSNRPYKPGWDPSQAVSQMARWTNFHLDEQIFQVFVRTVGIYPVGSLVRLESGRLAVVIEPGRTTLTAPVVKAFFDVPLERHIAPETIDLSEPGIVDRIIAREDPSRWAFQRLDELWQMPH